MAGELLTVTMNPAIDLSMRTSRIAPIRKTRCTDVRRHPGGGGINVARVLRRLGARCSAFHTAGGTPGALLSALVRSEGVTSVPFEIGQDTRENFAVLEEATGDEYRFVLPGPSLTGNEWRGCLDRIANLPKPGDYVIASGSLPPGAPETFYAEVSELVARRGARMILDASGAGLARAIERGVYLVKPNLRELCDLVGEPLGTEAEWEQAAMNLVRSGGAEIVALTLAERGALLVTKDLALRASGVVVPVSSATGAGDSFLGALVWKLSSGGSLAEALSWGMAAGAASLLTGGTELCHRADVERLVPEIRVRTIEI